MAQRNNCWKFFQPIDQPRYEWIINVNPHLSIKRHPSIVIRDFRIWNNKIPAIRVIEQVPIDKLCSCMMYAWNDYNSHARKGRGSKPPRRKDYQSLIPPKYAKELS